MRKRLMIAFSLLGGLFAFITQSWAMGQVTIFAASSTKPVFDILAPKLEAQGITLRVVHAGSSTLARQIEHGAPADIFISANVRWMDYLIDRGQIEHDSKRMVAGNKLVLIAGPNPFPAPRMAFGPGYPLKTVLGDERLAIADPDHVPAGIYAREALGALRLWGGVRGNLVRTLDVTGTLMMVARGEARLGIVYASDVKRSSEISTFATFPPLTHSPIVYPAAIVKDRKRDAVHRVMDTLLSDLGRKAFAMSGFEVTP